MRPTLIHVGNNNFVNATRIVAAMSPKSITTRRALKKASALGLVLDYTLALRTMGVLLMDTGILIRIPLRPMDIAGILKTLDKSSEME